jgi:hypothetical protein
MVPHTCNPSHVVGIGGGSWSEAGPDKNVRPNMKNN